MKKILLSVLALTAQNITAQVENHQSSHLSEISEDASQKGQIISALAKKEYHRVCTLFASNSLTDSDKAEIFEFCQQCIRELEENQKGQKVALKTFCIETAITSALFLLISALIHKKRLQARNWLRAQRTALNTLRDLPNLNLTTYHNIDDYSYMVGGQFWEIEKMMINLGMINAGRQLITLMSRLSDIQDSKRHIVQLEEFKKFLN